MENSSLIFRGNYNNLSGATMIPVNVSEIKSITDSENNMLELSTVFCIQALDSSIKR